MKDLLDIGARPDLTSVQTVGTFSGAHISETAASHFVRSIYDPALE